MTASIFMIFISLHQRAKEGEDKNASSELILIPLQQIKYKCSVIQISEMQNQKMIYLIRHAESEYNISEKKIEQKFEGKPYFEDPEYLKLKFNFDYEDCGITQKGYQQCAECKEKMKNIPVDLVIVSPLRRSLQTCHQVFQDHQSNFMVIVDPDFREIAESVCDIGSRLPESRKEYHTFDYSLIADPQTWYIQSLVDQTIKAELKDKVKNSDLAPKEVMIEFLKQIWEKRKENPEQKKKVLPCVEAQRNKLKELIKNHNSIAIVSHSENFKSYIGYKPPNCSVFKYDPKHLNEPLGEQLPPNYL